MDYHATDCSNFARNANESHGDFYEAKDSTNDNDDNDRNYSGHLFIADDRVK